ncbi:zf-HC2 domain-containing protein [Streptomyces sp. NPDC046197]|uniref:anti-sigma factor family protein n=1 Tax=Streptomyces sp. NPDC046197 TaxID=3154337 RepID=UPI003406B884
MSGSRPNPAASRLAEQHLGDRLSALVDGELGHETRERVLAHLATCPKCKAEVDAQRRLKNVFAEAAPPPPSASLLARLQGLPGDDPDGGGSPLDGAGFSGPLPGRSGIFGVRRDERFEFGYVPAGPHGADATAVSSDAGFRIHPVGRGDGERSASRGMRFAFVAAGAVSLAAIALGGVTTGMPGDAGADTRSGTGGSNVTPARTAGGGAATSPETLRRRSGGPLLAQGQRSSGGIPAAPTALSAPLLPGMPSRGAGQTQDIMSTLTTPVVAGAALVSPLIRPLTANSPINLTSWSSTPVITAPGVLAVPVPAVTPAATSSATSTSSASSRTAH